MTTTPHRSTVPRIAGHPSAEEALHRTAALLRQTEAISRVGGWEYVVATNHLVWSEEVYRIHEVALDFDANDVTQAINFHQGESRQRIDLAFRRAVERGEPFDLELELLTAKGRKIWVRAIGRAEVSNGQVMRVYGNLADITERKLAEESLRVSTKEVFDLKAALDEHAIVAITDPQGKITFVNDKFCAISQYSRSELLGQDHRLINSGHHSKAFIRDLWRTISRGKVWHGEIKNKAKDGTFYWVDTTIVPFLHDDGKPRQYVAIRADITERKQAEVELLRLAILVKSSDDAIIGKTLDGIITAWNPGAERIFGYSAAEAIGRSMLVLFPPERIAEEATILAQIARGENVQHYETELVRRDGTRIDTSVTLSGITGGDGRIIGAVKIARDISERKRADREIHRLNSELEQRVRDRTAQLEVANKELEAFSFSVSHDLRAPLRAIDSFSRMLVEDNGPQLDAEGRRLLDVVCAEAKRMGKLIDDLLAFSRIGRQRMEDSDIDMTELARATFTDVTRTQSNVPRLELTALPPIHGDRSMLRQVWFNLLANAVKFSGKQAQPVIAITGSAADGTAAYSVTDNGAGFDQKFAGKLFGVFQRLHSEEEFEGTGVGLALVQRIIHRHGGTVAATGKLHGGAAFQFTLPKSINEKT